MLTKLKLLQFALGPSTVPNDTGGIKMTQDHFTNWVIEDIEKRLEHWPDTDILKYCLDQILVSMVAFDQTLYYYEYASAYERVYNYLLR